MALTTAEEALVRQLLEQQAAILSLASNESTITSKLGATKVTLSDLIAASSVTDTDLLLMRQGTSDKSVTPVLLKNYAQTGMATPKAVQAGDYNTSVAGGTADALTGNYTPDILALEDGLTLFVRANTANTTTTPTFSPDGLTAKTIVKGNNLALAAGDVAGAGHWLELTYDAALDRWVLLNPYMTALQIASTAEAQALSNNIKAISPLRLKEAFEGSNQNLATSGYQKLLGGLIMQWGLTGVIAHNSSANITFPVAFTSAVFNVSLCISSNIGLTAVGDFAVANLTTLSVFHRADNNSSAQLYWLAIGI